MLFRQIAKEKEQSDSVSVVSSNVMTTNHQVEQNQSAALLQRDDFEKRIATDRQNSDQKVSTLRSTLDTMRLAIGTFGGDLSGVKGKLIGLQDVASLKKGVSDFQLLVRGLDQKIHQLVSQATGLIGIERQNAYQMGLALGSENILFAVLPDVEIPISEPNGAVAEACYRDFQVSLVSTDGTYDTLHGWANEWSLEDCVINEQVADADVGDGTCTRRDDVAADGPLLTGGKDVMRMTFPTDEGDVLDYVDGDYYIVTGKISADDSWRGTGSITAWSQRFNFVTG